MLRDLRDAWGWIQKLVRRVERVESGAFLENSSITEGRMRFIGGLLLIDSGGTLQVIGTVTGAGTFDWTGPMNLQGAQTITGPTTFTGQMTVNGPWKFVGNGQITGDVSVTGDIEILSGGRIKVGNMIIDPTDGGTVTFPNGAVVQADGSGGVQMRQGANKVFVGPSLVSLQYGSRSISINASGQRMGGVPTTPASLANGAAVGCAWFDPTGQVYRVVDG